MMWTQQKPSDGLGRIAYGLGWQFGTTDGVKDVGHGGSQQGTSTTILIAPDARAGVVVLTNSDSANAPETGQSEVIKSVLRLPRYEHKEIAVDPRVFDSYLGSYRLDDFTIAITREGDRLFYQVRDEKIPQSPESARDYVLKDTETHIVFMSDGNRKYR